MIDLAYLAEMGLSQENAEKLLEALEATTQQQLEARRETMPRVLAATPGGDLTPQLQEQFATMGYAQRLRMKRENASLYEQLAGGR